MDEKDYPAKVTLGEDGVYRWSYDMDMYDNRYMLNVLLKIFGIICVVCYALLMFLFARDHALTGGIAFGALMCFAGFMLLVVIGYYIAAAVMHGVYRVRFEMNDEAVMLIRKPSTNQMMKNMTLLTMLVSPAAGASMNAAAAAGFTRFSEVLGLKERRQYDAFNLRCITSGFQIYVRPQDYDFVLEYVKSRVPEKLRKRLG